MDASATALPDDEQIKGIASHVNSEISLARNGYTTTHQWVITLTIALITAILALGRGQPDYPSEYGLVAVLAIVPLMVRFFVRSCLEYAIFMRWVKIRNAIDCYHYTNPSETNIRFEARAYLDEVIRTYYYSWKSPLKKIRLIWFTLRMAFLWPAIMLVVLIYWGIHDIGWTPIVLPVFCAVVVYLIIEICWFTTYDGFEWVRIKAKKPDILRR